MPNPAEIIPLHAATRPDMALRKAGACLLSVIITTRNRPLVFARALRSVLDQQGADFELIVVEDGSDAVHRSAYGRLLASAQVRLGARVRLLSLPSRVNGHGSGGTMNAGAAAAHGDYLAFLDDDDEWTADDHLASVQRRLEQAQADGQSVDLYLSNQEAWQDGRAIAPRWLATVHTHLLQTGRQPDADGCFRVSTADLLTAGGFCHTNCLVVRRALYQRIGGRAAALRWEGDHNLYLRLLDRARHIVYQPAVTARHHVPDAAVCGSVTTRLQGSQRRRYQAQSMAHAAAAVSDPALRARARQVQGYALKHATLEADKAGQRAQAAELAWQAQAVQPGLKWWIYACCCSLKRLLGARDDLALEGALRGEGAAG